MVYIFINIQGVSKKSVQDTFTFSKMFFNFLPLNFSNGIKFWIKKRVFF